MADRPSFVVLLFANLDSDQMRRIEHMPRWLSTVPSIDPLDRNVFVNVRIGPGDVLDDVDRELGDWLGAHNLPQGRRLPTYSA